MSYPHFIVIGAQKSASSFVQKCLADHPDIWMPRGETPFFEDPDYKTRRVDYFDCLFSGRKETVLGIKRPNHIGEPEVPGRIANDLPNVKLIAVLRNPIERAVSAYFHYMRGGYIPPLDIEDGLPKVIHDHKYRKKYPRSSEIIEYGLYFKYLSLYTTFLSNGRLNTLLHEEVKKDPLHSVRSLYRFLNVDLNYYPRVLNARPQAGVYNLRRLKALRAINLISSKFNHDRTRSYGKRNLFLHAAGALYEQIDRALLGTIMSNGKPNLSQALRTELLDIYRPDIECLERLIRKDLSSWKR